jgi:hypothetical protein
VCRGGTIVVIVVGERHATEDVVDIEKVVVAGEEIIGVVLEKKPVFDTTALPNTLSPDSRMGSREAGLQIPTVDHQGPRRCHGFDAR